MSVLQPIQCQRIGCVTHRVYLYRPAKLAGLYFLGVAEMRLLFYAKNEEERVVGAVIGGAIFLFGLAVGGIVGDALDRVTNGKLFDYLMERMGLK